MRYSGYQQAIFDFLQHGTGYGIVQGVAGCGKTTTIVEGVSFIPNDQQVLLLAFNSHIKEALAERIQRPNVTISTCNAFGWGVCRRNYPQVKLDKFKDRNILCHLVDQYNDGARFNRLKGPLLKTIGLLKALCHTTSNDYFQVCQDYGVGLADLKDSDRFAETLAEAYEISVGHIAEMSFDDQIFQPIYRNWAMPKFDIVLVDEAQDCSPVNIETIKRISNRAILIGDPDQSIYLFRGAHPDAMGSLANDLNATILPLSVCYRCPDAVIESARAEVPRIESPQPNPRGEGLVETVNCKVFQDMAAPGDLVLCRMTHPLIKQCLIQWGRGRRAKVKGRELTGQLVELMEKAYGVRAIQLKKDYNTCGMAKIEDYRRMLEIDPSLAVLPTPKSVEDVYEFIGCLREYIVTQKEHLLKRGLEDQADQLEDRAMGIEALSDGCTHAAQIIIKIESMFSDDEDHNVILFMTGHKAKGLEFDRVWILRPDLIPHKRAKTAAALKQEANLLYVMKTRSMNELRFVLKEKDEK